MSNDILTSVENGVGTIQLNRPSRKNALTLDMADDWAEALLTFRNDPDVNVILLTGAGSGFCSGVDLTEIDKELSPLDWKTLLSERVHRIPLILEDIDKPVIAAVNGVAVGAGMDMALMCDVRFAARSATFSEGYIRIGLVPGDGGSYYLPRLVGPAKALQLLWTGDVIGAQEAERLGIVNGVWEDDDLLVETRRFAERLAASPSVAIRMIKRSVYQSMRTDLRTSLDLISSHMAVVGVTGDAHEALVALREKRKANFVER